MGILYRFINALVFGWLACAAAMAGAQEDLLGKARELLAQRKGAAAYELLKPAAEANAGNPDFDLLYGMAAIDAGKPAEAAFALERVLDVQPDNAAAHAELGRAYYEMGENDTARARFERARGEKLPLGVQQTIDRYLSAIQARLSAARTTYNAYVETGFGYDSNVNSATDTSQITIPVFGNLPFTLDPSGVEQDSGIWDLNAGFNFTSPLNPIWRLYGGIDLFHRANLEDTECVTAEGRTSCSTSGANGSLGVQYAPTELDRYRLAIFGQKFYVGSDENRDLGGANAEYVRAVGPRDQVNAFVQGAFFRFPEQGIRDVNRLVGGVGWGHAFEAKGRPITFVSVFGGTELEEEDNAFGVGRNLVGGRVGGEYSLSNRARAYASFNYQGSWYDSATPGFAPLGADLNDCDAVDCREDDYYSVDGGLRYAITRHISVRPEVRYTRNNSNVVLTDYDRWEALVTFRSDF
ncbi:MAG: tetratricopeptide repeat protein [Chromatiales bacterium]